MSLTISESGSKERLPLIPEGTYVGICNMLVDLGLQYSEQYDRSTRKVLVGWELPEELCEIKGETVRRTITQRYTASLNEKSTLRRDLIAWRGRDFTADELSAFNLRSIVSAPCMLQIIHREFNGKTYASIAGIMKLPKGMPRPELIDEAVVYDIDEDELSKADTLPEWIKEIVKGSESYQEKCKQQLTADLGDDFKPYEGCEDDVPF